jgi:hypothetical protein
MESAAAVLLACWLSHASLPLNAPLQPTTPRLWRSAGALSVQKTNMRQAYATTLLATFKEALQTALASRLVGYASCWEAVVQTSQPPVLLLHSC